MSKSKRPPSKASTEEAFFQRRLTSLPAFQSGGEAPALPAVTAPSLEKLLVTAPAPAPVTADELIAYGDQLVRERAPRKPRKPGERLELGDEAVVDVLGYANGKLIPFSARRGLVVEVGGGAVLPWLDEALAECAVGDSVQLPVTFPDDEPVELLRGANATFLVDIVSASTPRVPEPDSPEFLQLLGPGPTVDEAMNAVADQLEGERVADAWDEARERVIDEIVGRTEVSLTPALVDEEIRRTWQRLEVPFLLTRNFEPDEQQEALEGWLNDGPTRLDTERRLRLALALKAIAERDKLQFDREALRLVAAEAHTRFGLTDAELEEGVADPALHPVLTNLGLHLRALQTVFAAASVKFEGMEGVFPLVE